MLPLKILRLRSKGLLPRRLIAAVEPDSKEWHVSQTGHTVQREAKVVWLAQVTDALLGHASWKGRGAPCSPMRRHRNDRVGRRSKFEEACDRASRIVCHKAPRRQAAAQLDSPVSEPKLLDPRDISD